MAILESEATLNRNLVQRLDEFTEISLQKMDMDVAHNIERQSDEFNSRRKDDHEPSASSTKK